MRFAADNATLGQPEVLLGVIPGMGGTQRLARLVGPSRAKDLIFTGRFIKADEALAIGLVDRVLPADEVYDEALAWARGFANAAPWALRAAKECIDRGLETDLETGLEIERQQFAGLFATEDRTIGMHILRRERSRQGRVRGRERERGGPRPRTGSAAIRDPASRSWSGWSASCSRCSWRSAR